jgi:hypothetical protein
MIRQGYRGAVSPHLRCEQVSAGRYGVAMRSTL